MFEKTYRAYLDLNSVTKAHIILVIKDDFVFLTVDQLDLYYVGALSARGACMAYDSLRLFERLHADKFAEWNE